MNSDKCSLVPTVWCPHSWIQRRGVTRVFRCHIKTSTLHRPIEKVLAPLDIERSVGKNGDHPIHVFLTPLRVRNASTTSKFVITTTTGQAPASHVRPLTMETPPRKRRVKIYSLGGGKHHRIRSFRGDGFLVVGFVLGGASILDLGWSGMGDWEGMVE